MKPKPIHKTKQKRLKPTPFARRENWPVSSHGHMIREAFRSDRKPRKPLLVRGKPRHTGVLWGTIMLWVASFFVSVFTVFFSDFHAIRTVEVVGTRDVSSAEIESFVFGRLSGFRFRIFPADNFYLIPTDSLERDILREFPKLSTVSVTRGFPNRILVVVGERDHILLWCSGGPCVQVGDNGVALDAAQAEKPENEPFLLRVVDMSARPVDVGEPLLSVADAEAILRLECDLREQSDIAFSPVFSSPSRVSGEVRITTDEGWDILAGLDIDPDKTVASLRLVLDKEIPAEKRSALRYIDLRTENRAFFAYEEKEREGGGGEE